MSGRERFQCVRCGLVTEGRELPNGDVVPYDRGPVHDPAAPARRALCASCREKNDSEIDAYFEIEGDDAQGAPA